MTLLGNGFAYNFMPIHERMEMYREFRTKTKAMFEEAGIALNPYSYTYMF